MNHRAIKFHFVTALTLGRIPLILIFLAVNLLLIRPDGNGGWCLMSPGTHGFWYGVAFGAMVLSALTDLFDGYFARKFQVESKLGAYADPLTDKVFYLTTFPTLVFLAALHKEQFLHSQLLLGLTIVFLMRDQWISFLRSIGALYQVDAKANWSGKARTIISFPAICTIYWYLQAPDDWFLGFIGKNKFIVYSLEVVSLLINLISIWVYTRHYWPCIRKEIEQSHLK
jgi:CDP-diacylglycerol--glycerol-3-phosphate 3-phosphatidyltransferase